MLFRLSQVLVNIVWRVFLPPPLNRVVGGKAKKLDLALVVQHIIFNDIKIINKLMVSLKYLCDDNVFQGISWSISTQNIGTP